MFFYVITVCMGTFRFADKETAEWFDGSFREGRSHIATEEDLSLEISQVNAGTHFWKLESDSGINFWRFSERS